MNRKQFIANLGLGAVSMPSLLSAPWTSPREIKLPSTDSWPEIQKQFLPITDTIYMNNGTMGITPRPVLTALQESFELVAKSGHYPSDLKTIKKRLAPLIGVDTKTIAITKNVTEGINIACWGNELSAGDEVLMTTHEHVGGCAAWLYRAATEGIKIKTFALGATAEETFSNFKKALSPKTKIVAVPHIPCTIGQILPIKDICTEARNRGITSIIDGAHPLGMIQFNITELGCDYYAGCLHKWLLAPLGLGFIYIHPSRLSTTKIHNIGAYSIADFDMTAENPMNKNLVDETQRFSAGTFCGPLYDAAVRAIDWYIAVGPAKIEARVKDLTLHAQTELRKMTKDIHVLTPLEEKSRGAQTTFSFQNKKAPDFLKYAQSFNPKFILRHVHEGKLDAVRISTHYYNDHEQIDALIEKVRGFVKG
jgi:selenocysteine lyase/cysteine desulfurase